MSIANNQVQTRTYHPNPFSPFTSQRPNGRMPLEVHKEVGSKLKAVIASVRLPKKLEAVRSTLDDWLEQEYSRAELSDQDFFNVYYHGEGLPKRDPAQDLEDINRAYDLLTQNYSACEPLTRLLLKLDATRAQVGTARLNFKEKE